MRHKLLNEQIPKLCKDCHFTEKSHLQKNIRFAEGSRTRFDNYLGVDFTDYSSIMRLEHITFIELWFSNKCNLKCRMCSPKHSDQLLQEWPGIINSVKDSKDLFPTVETPDLDWTTNDASWKNLFKFIQTIFNNLPSQIVTIVMSGGEPMLCDGMYKFFELCLEHNVAKNLILRYNTNLTILPTKMVSYWRYFKQIRIIASIDGYNTINDYIRFPSKWSKICSNIELLRDLQSNVNLELYVHPTIQCYNILNITELYNWCINTPFKSVVSERHEYKHILFDRLSNPLVDPKLLNITILPKVLKDLAVERLVNFFETDNKYIKEQNIKNSLQVLIKYIYSRDNSRLFPDFLRFTTHLDKSRNQNILDIMPELRQL